MKKKLITIILASCLLTGCGKVVPKLENGQDAMVNFADGTKISVDEIWEEVKNDYALAAVINKIDLKILSEKYADKMEDAEKYIKTYEATLKATYGDKLEQTLQNAGVGSLSSYLIEQKIAYLTNIAVTDYAKSLVSESSAKEYYEKNTVGDISAVHILVKPASDSSDALNSALEKAKEIISKIDEDVKSGTSKKDAFVKYSDDKTVTYQDLGEFNKGDMVEAFENAAYDLKVDEYSSTPVKTEYGYHIILKTGEKEKASYDDVKDDILETLAKEKIEDDSTISTTAMVELRKEYGVEITDSEIENKYNQYINYLLNK